MTTPDTQPAKSTFDELIKRFSDATFDCDTIRKHVTECKAYVTACRVTAEANAPDAHKYNLALLASAMQTHGFTEPDAADLDAVTTYLDNVDRGATEIMRHEQQALNAVMQLPFAFKMLGRHTNDAGEEISRIEETAKATFKAASNRLQREVIICRLICDIVNTAERWAMKNAHGKGNADALSYVILKKLTNLENGQNLIREDIANSADDICETFGKERIPPKPKEVDQTSRRNLFELLKRIKNKPCVGREDKEIFLEKTTWTYKGFTAREIYKDVEGLDLFYNAERMAIKRQQPDKS